MGCRSWVAVLLCVSVALASCPTTEPPTPPQVGPEAKVRLSLSQAAVQPLGEDVLFICEAVIDNATGAELTVQSHYDSAFDGLDLVVMDERGRKLAQQPYVHHQSLFSAEGRGFVLARGENRRELRFPVSGLPWKRGGYRVLLVGQLPGSDYCDTLCSNLVTAVSR